MKPKPTKCLYPPCGNPVHSRGLCRSCYSQAGLAVRSGKTTWAELEKAGRVLPAKGRQGVTGWLLGKDK